MKFWDAKVRQWCWVFRFDLCRFTINSDTRKKIRESHHLIDIFHLEELSYFCPLSPIFNQSLFRPTSLVGRFWREYLPPLLIANTLRTVIVGGGWLFPKFRFFTRHFNLLQPLYLRFLKKYF